MNRITRKGFRLSDRCQFILSGAAVLLMIAAVFISGILNVQKVWPDVSLDYRDGRKAFSLDAGDAYGVVAHGPYHDLAAGRYRLQWQIEGDADNLIRLSCSNDIAITPSEWIVKGGQWQGSAEFELAEAAHNISINVEFASGSRMQIHNFRLYSPEYTDDAWTFAFILLAGWLIFVAGKMGKLTDRRWRTLMMIGFATAMVSVPCFRADCLTSYDLQFHAARIMNIVDGLKAGQFPVRVGGFSYNGYGAATSVFYPDLLLYPLALLIMGGASINYVLHLSCILASACSGAAMYAAVKRIFSDSNAACCAAVLYICSVYRLEDMYTRYMLGEIVAMAFLPVFLLGLWEIVRGDSRRWPLLVLGATLVFQSHMCSTLLCAGLAVCVCIVFIPRFLSERARLCALAAAIASTLAVNLFTLVPFVTLYVDGANTPTAQFGFLDSMLSVRSLIIQNGYMGKIMWPGIPAALCALVLDKDAEHRKNTLLFLVIGGAACIMSTNLFPWRSVVQLTGGMIQVIQFTFRFLVIAAPCVAVIGGYGLSRLMRGMDRMLIFVTLVLAIGAWPYVNSVLEKDVLIEFGNGANPYMIYPEYQYEGTDTANTRSRAVLSQGDASITQYEKRGTQASAHVHAVGDAQLSFPMFGFEGYEATLNGERIAWSRGENNRLTVSLAAGTSGQLHIRYAGKALWRIADCISLISAAALCIFAWRRYAAKRKN